MDFQIELNRRFGYGFQIRAIYGPACEVYDDEPLTMLEAMQSIDDMMGGKPSKVTVRHIGLQGHSGRAGGACVPAPPRVRE